MRRTPARRTACPLVGLPAFFFVTPSCLRDFVVAFVLGSID
jgi:hypothetical protein